MDATRRGFLGAAALGVGGTIGLLGWSGFGAAAPKREFPFKRSEAQWKAMLTPAAYRVLRQEGTETPFSSPLNDEHRAGTFACAGCGRPLFSSRTKFDSGTGWPSFWQPLKGAVGTTTDRTLGMSRTEVHCAHCGGHQGHVFDDGPKPTGLRYCMNGVSMRFVPGRA